MWVEIGSAMALVLVIEGLLPALLPETYKRTILQMAMLDEKKLRTIGIGSMIAGAILLYLIRN